MSRKDNKSSILYWMFKEFSFMLTIVAILIVSKATENLESDAGWYLLAFALAILSMKAHFLFKYEPRDALIKQIKRWLAEMSLVLGLAAFKNTSSPVIFAVLAVLSVVFAIPYLMLVARSLVNYTEGNGNNGT